MKNAIVTLCVLGASSSVSAGPTSDPRGVESGVAGEVNVLWPLIGISQLKAIIPVSTSGELVTGLYADYAQIVRPNAGKVALIAAIAGWRQFLYRGLHAELTATIGVRHEMNHPGDGMTLNDGYVRAWPMLGYQLDISPRIYVNARGGVGVLVYRQSHWSEERKLAPGADINVGVWF
jgi:hypothetical protein